MGSQQKRQTYIVICEGKSEVAYLTELSRFFQENDVDVIFLRPNAGSGRRSVIENCLKKELKKNKNKIDDFLIFLDKDIYLNPNKNRPSDWFKDLYLFNTYCFEDFLVLHLEESQIKNWDLASSEIQKKYYNKSDVPSQKKVSDLLVTSGIFSAYKKGELPKGFEFSFEILNRLIINCNNSKKFKSDFVTKILSIYSSQFNDNN